MSERERLRIALASIEYPPDPFSAGIGAYTKTLADQLTARGHSVHVVTRGTDRDERTDERGVTVLRLTPGRPRLPDSLGIRQIAALVGRSLPGELAYRRKVARTLERLAADEALDLIEVADHMGEPVSFRPDRFPHLPFVVRLHTPLAVTEKGAPNIPEPARLGIRQLERRLLLKASHLSAPSRVAAGAILGEMNVDRSVAIYPNPPTFAHPERVSMESDQKIVLFVGRINALKGPQFLVEAIPEIVERHPGTRFLFVGADNIPYEGHPTMGRYLLSRLPDEVRHSVELVGHVPHGSLPDYYRRAAVCVFPSLFESFGYTCLEAMGFGKAIIGSASGGMADMLDEGRAGLLFTPPDVRQLRHHIVRLLGDPELRRTLGARARQRALEAYGPERVLEQAEEFYRRAIAERGPKHLA